MLSDAMVRSRTMVWTGLGPDWTNSRVQVQDLPRTRPVVRFPIRRAGVMC